MSHLTKEPSLLKRVLLQLACALLLFSQYEGLAHAVWHAAQQLPHEQQRVQQERPQKPAAPQAAKLCALDVAFAQVLGGGPTACHQLPIESAGSSAVAHDAAHFASLRSPTPRSRGPPSPA